MPRIVLYHNPGCSKSRGALEILRERDVELDVIEYLESPPDREELLRILAALPDPPSALVRRDATFEALGLDAGDIEEASAVVDLLLAQPQLMQRPLALRDGRAVIARPCEKVLSLLD